MIYVYIVGAVCGFLNCVFDFSYKEWHAGSGWLVATLLFTALIIREFRP